MQTKTNKTEHVVVVGGGQAAAQLIDSLRRMGHHGRITLVSEEDELPYQRPPLSKSYLGGGQHQDWLLYRPRGFYQDHKVETLLGQRAIAVNRERGRVILEQHRELRYDRLALTTGCRVRKLAGAEGDRVHYLRSLQDVARISAQLANARRLVVIGGGFIGLEVAATLQARNIQVTVLEAENLVLNRVVAPLVSEFFLAEHQRRGVDIRTGVKVSAISSVPGQSVALDCGPAGRFEADLLIIGVGVLPNDELAREAGLECDNGIVVDECARTSDPAIVAAGDCTRHPNAILGRQVRLETVHNAVEQAKAAAASLLGLEQPYRQVPWVWSDQYDLRLQSVGDTTGHDQLIVRGDLADRRFAVFYFRAGCFTGMNSVNRPHDFAACRRILNRGLTLTAAQAEDPQCDLARLAPQRGGLLFDPAWRPLSERRKGPLAALTGSNQDC